MSFKVALNASVSKKWSNSTCPPYLCFTSSPSVELVCHLAYGRGISIAAPEAIAHRTQVKICCLTLPMPPIIPWHRYTRSSGQFCCAQYCRVAWGKRSCSTGFCVTTSMNSSWVYVSVFWCWRVSSCLTGQFTSQRLTIEAMMVVDVILPPPQSRTNQISCRITTATIHCDRVSRNNNAIVWVGRTNLNQRMKSAAWTYKSRVNLWSPSPLVQYFVRRMVTDLFNYTNLGTWASVRRWGRVRHSEWIKGWICIPSLEARRQ